jgi:hypothetical protein
MLRSGVRAICPDQAKASDRQVFCKVEPRGSLANSGPLACLLVLDDVEPESPWCVRTGTGRNKTSLLFTLPSGFGC